MLPHDEMYHYGIRGMRWGVRRKGPSLGTRIVNNKGPIGKMNRSLNKMNDKIGRASDFSNPEKRKKALKIAGATAVGAVAVGGAVLALRNPKFRNRIARATWSAKDQEKYTKVFQDRVSDLNWVRKDYRVGTPGWHPKNPRAVEMRKAQFEWQGKEIKRLLDLMSEEAKKNPELVKLNNGW